MTTAVWRPYTCPLVLDFVYCVAASTSGRGHAKYGFPQIFGASLLDLNVAVCFPIISFVQAARTARNNISILQIHVASLHAAELLGMRAPAQTSFSIVVSEGDQSSFTVVGGRRWARPSGICSIGWHRS